MPRSRAWAWHGPTSLGFRQSPEEPSLADCDRASLLGEAAIEVHQPQGQLAHIAQHLIADPVAHLAQVVVAMRVHRHYERLHPVLHGPPKPLAPGVLRVEELGALAVFLAV